MAALPTQPPQERERPKAAGRLLQPRRPPRSIWRCPGQQCPTQPSHKAAAEENTHSPDASTLLLLDNTSGQHSLRKPGHGSCLGLRPPPVTAVTAKKTNSTVSLQGPQSVKSTLQFTQCRGQSLLLSRTPLFIFLKR